MYQNKLCELYSDLSKIDRLIVVGDLHGDYESFRKILSLFNPDRDSIMFLGDYADRGAEGIEVIDGVNELIVKSSGKVVGLKGNHEDYTEDGKPMFVPCDLTYEADEKKGGWATYFEDELKPLINKLYLSALVPGEVLFIHGGVSRRVRSIEDLRYPSRLVETDVLWSDPFDEYGEGPNMRGAGVMFGKDVSAEICRWLGVEMILRSHQPTKACEGPCVEHDGRVITLSSTTVYNGKPFILNLPAKNLKKALKNLERYTVYLR